MEYNKLNNLIYRTIVDFVENHYGEEPDDACYALDELAAVLTRAVSENKEATASTFASFVVRSWHSCPLPPHISVPDCECWGSEHCAKCLVMHEELLSEKNQRAGQDAD